MAARADDLLPVEYFHVVFTLPAEIARIVYWNKRELYGLLFKASAETVATIAADPKHLGARVGMTSVLHTWGSAMTHHPHIHMIVPGGGLSPGGTRWIACKPGFFLPVRVLSRLFRRLFLDGLMVLHRAGKLAFFGDLTGLADAEAFASYLAPQHKTEWVVYAKPPFGGPEAVLAYLSRYTHRVAISNHRLVSADADTVAFRWKDYRIKHGRADEGHAARHARVHPPVPDPCAPGWFPSHPALRPAGKHRPQDQHRKDPHIARRGSGHAGRRIHHRDHAAHPARAMPGMRRRDAHRRDIPARRDPTIPRSTEETGRMTECPFIPSGRSPVDPINPAKPPCPRRSEKPRRRRCAASISNKPEPNPW